MINRDRYDNTINDVRYKETLLNKIMTEVIDCDFYGWKNTDDVINTGLIGFEGNDSKIIMQFTRECIDKIIINNDIFHHAIESFDGNVWASIYTDNYFFDGVKYIDRTDIKK